MHVQQWITPSKKKDMRNWIFFYRAKLNLASKQPILLLLFIYSLEFFTSVLADGFSLEFEWQQVSLSLQD